MPDTLSSTSFEAALELECMSEESLQSDLCSVLEDFLVTSKDSKKDPNISVSAVQNRIQAAHAAIVGAVQLLVAILPVLRRPPEMITRHQHALTALTNGALSRENLLGTLGKEGAYTEVFCSIRSLLISLGLEAQKPREKGIDSFTADLIEEGMSPFFDPRYRSIGPL